MFPQDCTEPYRLVTADKEHPQEILPDLTRQEDLWIVLQCADVFFYILLENATAARSPAQLSHKVVVCHPKEPSRRIVRQTRNRPGLKCGHQGGLNGILNIIDVLHSHAARERSNEPAVFVPEKVLNYLGRAQGV